MSGITIFYHWLVGLMNGRDEVSEFTLTIKDLPGGGSRIEFNMDNVGNLTDPDNNTLTQNTAIFIAIKLKEMEIDIGHPATKDK